MPGQCSCVLDHCCCGLIPGPGYDLCDDCGAMVGKGMHHSCDEHNARLAEFAQTLSEAVAELENYKRGSPEGDSPSED